MNSAGQPWFVPVHPKQEPGGAVETTQSQSVFSMQRCGDPHSITHYFGSKKAGPCPEPPAAPPKSSAGASQASQAPPKRKHEGVGVKEEPKPRKRQRVRPNPPPVPLSKEQDPRNPKDPKDPDGSSGAALAVSKSAKAEEQSDGDRQAADTVETRSEGAPAED